MKKYSSLTTPIGKILLIGSHDGLEELRLPNNTKCIAPDPSWEYAPLFFQPIEQQLADYFTGIRQHFNIQFNIKGTAFQFTPQVSARLRGGTELSQALRG